MRNPCISGHVVTARVVAKQAPCELNQAFIIQLSFLLGNEHSRKLNPGNRAIGARVRPESDIQTIEKMRTIALNGIWADKEYFMILSDVAIKALLKKGDLSISSLTEEQVQSASVDIRLGSTFSVVDDNSNAIATLDQPVSYKMIEAETYILLPGHFVLATTQEYFKLPNDLTAFVEGRSSIGRLGLFIQNAGWVDPGFEGEITLELFNANRCAIELKKGRRVGQLVFAKLDQKAENPYSGKYQGQREATGSRIHLDSDI